MVMMVVTVIMMVMVRMMNVFGTQARMIIPSISNWSVLIEDHDDGGNSDCDGEHDEYRKQDPLYFSSVGLENLKVVLVMVMVMVMVSTVNMLGTVQCTSQNEDPLRI